MANGNALLGDLIQQNEALEAENAALWSFVREFDEWQSTEQGFWQRLIPTRDALAKYEREESDATVD